MITVVGPENDDGIVGQIVSLQSIQHATDLAIHKTHAGQVGLHNLNLLPLLKQKLLTRFRQLPMKVPAKTRGIRTIV